MALALAAFGCAQPGRSRPQELDVLHVPPAVVRGPLPQFDAHEPPGPEALQVRLADGLTFGYAADGLGLVAVWDAATAQAAGTFPVELMDRADWRDGYPAIRLPELRTCRVLQTADAHASEARLVYELHETGDVLRSLLATVTETAVRIDGPLGQGYARRFRVEARRALTDVQFDPGMDSYVACRDEGCGDEAQEGDYVWRLEMADEAHLTGPLRVVWMQTKPAKRVSQLSARDGYAFDLDAGESIVGVALVWPHPVIRGGWDAAIRDVLQTLE